MIPPTTADVVKTALEEDLLAGDATTESLVPEGLEGRAVIVPKAEGVLAGVGAAIEVFRQVDRETEFRPSLADGSPLKPMDSHAGREGDVIAEVRGRVASILRAERTALNFLQHLSGIATTTRKYVDAVRDYDAKILDTRKTVPGLRALEKHAVAAGGGTNHRLNLADGVLIKDNHIAALRRNGTSLAEIVRRARTNVPHTLRVEVEVENLDEVAEALEGGAEILLLDNMEAKDMALAVEISRGRAKTEASGGVTLGNVREVAQTGVDFISVGALTHSVQALDISLELM